MKDFSLLFLNQLVEDVVALEPPTIAGQATPLDKMSKKIYSLPQTNKLLDPLININKKILNKIGRNDQYPIISVSGFPVGQRYESDSKVLANAKGFIPDSTLSPLLPKTVSGPIQRGTSRIELNKVYPNIPIKKVW